MKLLFVFIIALFTCLSSYAQQAAKYEYCRFSGSPYHLTSAQVTIEIDSGQLTRLFRDNRLRDSEAGNLLIFNSMMSALNYMERQGWEFVQAYNETMGVKENKTLFLMRRPARQAAREEQNELPLEE